MVQSSKKIGGNLQIHVHMLKDILVLNQLQLTLEARAYRQNNDQSDHNDDTKNN